MLGYIAVGLSSVLRVLSWGHYQGRLSLSNVGDKCAKDNVGGFYITNFSMQKSIE